MKSLVAFVLALALPAFAGELEGVTHPDEVEVNGKKLVLNGLGLREATLGVDVYVAALYITAKTNEAGKILWADEEKQLCLKFVRDVDKADITNAWKEGFERNAAEETVKKLQPRIDQLNGWMADIKEKDSLTFTYIPGKGLEVKVKEEVKGTIEDFEFAREFFAIWLGAKPPNEGLKKGLLGK